METTESPVAPSTCGCQSKASAAPAPRAASRPGYIYALGTIEARFPTLGVEKEFMQSLHHSETAGKTDSAVLHSVLKANRYLARAVCWVFKIQGFDSYILSLTDALMLDQLIDALRPNTTNADQDLIVGTRGPLAPPEVCNGLVAPIVMVDQIYSFDIPSFINSIPRPASLGEDAFRPAAQEVFHRLQHMADNVGETDEHRALNYLAVRYPGVYGLAAEMFAKDCVLSSVDVRRDALSSTRKVLSVKFTFTSRKTDVVETFSTLVDVTEKWVYLVRKLAPMFELG